MFSVFALFMLALFVYHLATEQWSVINWGMLGVSATVCLLVFINFVFIFTYSYALAAVINASLIFIALPSAASGLLALTAVMYGLRLALFTRSRNRSASYAGKVAEIQIWSRPALLLPALRALPPGTTWRRCCWHRATSYC